MYMTNLIKPHSSNILELGQGRITEDAETRHTDGTAV